MFIDKMQRGDFLTVPGAQDSEYINKALNCLLGNSCLIPFQNTNVSRDYNIYGNHPEQDCSN